MMDEAGFWLLFYYACPALRQTVCMRAQPYLVVSFSALVAMTVHHLRQLNVTVQYQVQLPLTAPTSVRLILLLLWLSQHPLT